MEFMSQSALTRRLQATLFAPSARSAAERGTGIARQVSTSVAGQLWNLLAMEDFFFPPFLSASTDTLRIQN
jgi:hypothetical protein